MAHLIPSIGVRGLYTLLTPFQVKLLANTPYNCIGIRKLEDIVAAGGDPKALYYTANDQSDAKYDEDLALGACIVTLRAFEGPPVYVPSTFITSMPDQGGVPYTTLVLGVSLSAIPDSLDLTYLKSQVVDLVRDTIGVTSEVREVAVSPPTNLSQAEHATIEAVRAAAVAASQTDYAQLVAANAALAAARQKILELEAYILSLP